MDNKLKCDAVTCVHNLSHLCGAAVIEVQGGVTDVGDNTFCGTYAHRSLANYVGAATNMNVAGGLAQFVSDDVVMDPQVACTAEHCAYNAQGICQAEELMIAGATSSTAAETECETFRPR